MLKYECIENFAMEPGKGRYKTMIITNIVLVFFLSPPFFCMHLLMILCDTTLRKFSWALTIALSMHHKKRDLFEWKVGLLQRIYLGCDPKIWKALTQ